MHADTISIVNRICARESHSLLQYLHESWPWAGQSEDEALDLLQRIAASERRAARGLSDWLLRQHFLPATGSYPEPFTALNYLALDHLFPRLVAAQEQAISQLERDLADLDEETPRSLAQELVELKRANLQKLRALTEEHSGAKSVSTIR